MDLAPRVMGIPAVLAAAPRHLFLTGKGGLRKTSLACATAVGLAEAGRRVILVSTDPASNLDAAVNDRVGVTSHSAGRLVAPTAFFAVKCGARGV